MTTSGRTAGQAEAGAETSAAPFWTADGNMDHRAETSSGVNICFSEHRSFQLRST
jgi:hypothetical protein